MKSNVYCPFCEHEFKGEVWESGECPKCKEKYHWDEQCTEDYSDCWEVVTWEKLEGRPRLVKNRSDYFKIDEEHGKNLEDS